MEGMIISNAKYVNGRRGRSIQAEVDGILMAIPMVESNRYYAEILRQVEEGTLIIEEAE
jgi:hypothetical protein